MVDPSSSKDSSQGDRGAGRRLGELLVRFGWLSPEELDNALSYQRTAGERLGSCLLELGMIEEGQLEEALSELHGLPVATHEDLQRAPEAARGAFPERLLMQVKALPFCTVGDETWVAVTDPTNLSHLDDLYFASPRRLRLHTAVGIRLQEALARHLGLPLNPWQRKLLDQLEERRRAALQDASAAEPPPLLSAQRMSPTSALAKILHRLRSTDDRDEVGRALLDHLGATHEPVILLKPLVNGLLAGWMGRGRLLDPELLAGLRLSLHEPSVFRDLENGAGVQANPLPPLKAHRLLTSCWAGEPGSPAVVLPIRLQHRLACVAYAERKSPPSPEEIEELELISAEASIAFTRYLMRRKKRKA